MGTRQSPYLVSELCTDHTSFAVCIIEFWCAEPYPRPFSCTIQPDKSYIHLTASCQVHQLAPIRFHTLPATFPRTVTTSRPLQVIR